MKYRFSILIITSLTIIHTQALSISEIMSNPVGDDAGREWVEVYNDGASAVDLSTLSISIKGGTPVMVVGVQGGTTLAPGSYAIISSIVSSASPISRFLDTGTGYPNYAGILLRSASSISLVNTGSTSLDIRLNGSTVDGVSYTPAGEGKTLSRIQGGFVTGIPTPGADNQASVTTTATEESPNGSQIQISQTAPPSPDIVLYLPPSRLVVAGAETNFSVYGMTRGGQSINDISATWAFGDGGQAIGTTTEYAYAYPGKYLARVEAGNSSVRGMGTTEVVVVAPEVRIVSYGTGKYGAYIDIENPNDYDLDFSQWKLHINYQTYVFPKYTTLPKHASTRISGKAMGFDKVEFKDDTKIKITFPNLEEVVGFIVTRKSATSTTTVKPPAISLIKNSYSKSPALKISPTKQTGTTTPPLTVISKETKDTRLISWIKQIFRPGIY